MDSKEIYDFIIRIQAIAKIGLTYSKDPYAITNYNEINDLSKKFLEDFHRNWKKVPFKWYHTAFSVAYGLALA